MPCKALRDLCLEHTTELQSIIAIRSPLQLCFALFILALWYVQLDSSICYLDAQSTFCVRFDSH